MSNNERWHVYDDRGRKVGEVRSEESGGGGIVVEIGEEIELEAGIESVVEEETPVEPPVVDPVDPPVDNETTEEEETNG